MAAVEDITEGLLLQCRGGRDITIPFAVDLALLKPGGGGAEDEVDRALDVAILVILSAARFMGVECILETEEAAVDEPRPVTPHDHRHRLPHGAGIVCKSDVLGGEDIGRDIGGGRTGGADGISQRAEPGSEVVPGEDGAVLLLAHQRQVMLGLWYDQLLAVDAVADQDAGGLLPEIGHRIDRCLHRGEVARAILCHHPVETAPVGRFCRPEDLLQESGHQPDGGEVPGVEMPEGVGCVVESVHLAVDPQAVE